MKFHIFTVHNPNGYNGYDNEGQPIPATETFKICVNLSDITHLQQVGHYQNVPVRQDPTIPPEAVMDNVWGQDMPPITTRPQPRRGTTGRQRQPNHEQRQQWTILNDRYVIQLRKGSSWTVVGDFQEFANILAQFQDERETIE